MKGWSNSLASRKTKVQRWKSNCNTTQVCNIHRLELLDCRYRVRSILFNSKATRIHQIEKGFRKEIFVNLETKVDTIAKETTTTTTLKVKVNEAQDVICIITPKTKETLKNKLIIRIMLLLKMQRLQFRTASAEIHALEMVMTSNLTNRVCTLRCCKSKELCVIWVFHQWQVRNADRFSRIRLLLFLWMVIYIPKLNNIQTINVILLEVWTIVNRNNIKNRCCVVNNFQQKKSKFLE